MYCLLTSDKFVTSCIFTRTSSIDNPVRLVNNATASDIARAAVSTAKHIIAQVNPNVPRTLGDSMIHTDRIHAFVYAENPLPVVDYSTKVGKEELQIGKYIAELIEDGSTLQTGIGTIPDAVLKSLNNHKNLGVHTEMCSDGIIDLFEKDIINNSKKIIHPYKTVTGFAVGTKKLFGKVLGKNREKQLSNVSKTFCQKGNKKPLIAQGFKMLRYVVCDKKKQER